MTRLTMTLAIALVIAVVAACEPTGPPEFARRSSVPATARPSAGASAAASGGPSGSVGPGPSESAGTSAGVPTGSPRVEIAGDTVTVVGQGEKNSAVFPLDGTYNFETTACPGTGVIPFVWVYDEFANSRGTYVDPKFTVKNLKGNFYLRVQGPPTCAWTVTLTKA